MSNRVVLLVTFRGLLAGTAFCRITVQVLSISTPSNFMLLFWRRCIKKTIENPRTDLSCELKPETRLVFGKSPKPYSRRSKGQGISSGPFLDKYTPHPRSATIYLIVVFHWVTWFEQKFAFLSCHISDEVANTMNKNYKRFIAKK